MTAIVDLQTILVMYASIIAVVYGLLGVTATFYFSIKDPTMSMLVGRLVRQSVFLLLFNFICFLVTLIYGYECFHKLLFPQAFNDPNYMKIVISRASNVSLLGIIVSLGWMIIVAFKIYKQVSDY